ncbi:MAG: hypothetical protein AABY16_04445, partial [Nanoarchaeota archaeon]
MEPQNENPNTPLAQQPPPQNFFEKNKPLTIAGFVVLVILVIGGFYFLNQKQPQPIRETTNETATQTPYTQQPVIDPPLSGAPHEL